MKLLKILKYLLEIFWTASLFSRLQVNTGEFGLQISLDQGVRDMQYHGLFRKEWEVGIE